MTIKELYEEAKRIGHENDTVVIKHDRECGWYDWYATPLNFKIKTVTYRDNSKDFPDYEREGEVLVLSEY